MMTNMNGDYLVHPDPDKVFGFDLNKLNRFQDDYPSLIDEFESSNIHWIGMISEKAGKALPLASSMHKVYFDANKPQRFICLILTLPRDKILASLKSVHLQILGVMFAFLVVALVVGLYFSKSLTQPLLQIIEAIDSYGKGETKSIHVAKAPTDETGVLLHAFQHMVFQVEKRNNELRFSEARNRAVLEAAADAILTINDMGVIQATNTATEDLFGYTSQEMIGQRIEMLMPSPHRENHDGYLARHRGKDPDTAPQHEGVIGKIREISGIRKDGSVFPMELSVSRIWINNRQLFTGIIRDVTERKEAEAHLIAQNIVLEQKNKEAEQFTYSVSHDLKSPIVSCTGLMALAWEDLDANNTEGLRDSLGRIDRNVKRMEACINDLLEFCRVGRIRYEPQLLDMNQLIGQIACDMEPMIVQANATVQVQEDLPAVYADSARLTELFANLITNALKYGCEKQTVSVVQIGALRHGSELHYFVRDNGPGIEEKYHQKIFALFQRLSNDKQGSGVGLAIVSRIMELHNGRVWIESQPGQGATFWLAFPARSGHDA
jgi:PAS domain S-box-containing protein